MLETVRQYAAEQLQRLGEEAIWCQRHQDYYVAFAEQAEQEVWGDEQALWLDRLEQEHDNLRAAMQWSMGQLPVAGSQLSGSSSTGDQPVTAALRIANALTRFWEVRGYLAEGRRWLESALTSVRENAEPVPLVLKAKSLNRAGILARDQGDYPAAQALFEESLSLYREIGDERGIAYQLNNLGIVARYQRDYARAVMLYQQSLELQRARGDEVGMAAVLNNLGCAAQDQGDYAAARAFHEDSLGIRHLLEDEGGIALSLNNLAEVARWQGEVERATALSNQSLALFQSLGDRAGIATSLQIKAEVEKKQGHLPAAVDHLRESLALFEEAGEREGMADALAALAAAFAAAGEAARAARLFAAVESLRAALGSPLPPNVRAGFDAGVAAVRAALTQEEFALAWAEGKLLSWEAAVAAARELDQAGPLSEARSA
jgi:tetratricopeptide (TPR) repeat protein